MGKKLWNTEANNIHQSILTNPQLNNDGINIRQEPYRSDLFNIFRDAYKKGFCGTTKRPLISGDSIWSYARHTGWVHPENQTLKKRYEDIHVVQTWWDEWSYTWDRNPPKRSYKQN